MLASTQGSLTGFLILRTYTSRHGKARLTHESGLSYCQIQRQVLDRCGLLTHDRGASFEG